MALGTARAEQTVNRRARSAGPARTVAFVGGDGSGKSSIADRLVAEAGGRRRCIYMGPSLTSASHRLPTTRAWLALQRRRESAPPDSDGGTATTEARMKPSSLRRYLARALLQYLEVIHREIRVWWWLRSGSEVIFDRHILFEIWGPARPATPVDRARGGFARLLRATCRPPDLTILLLAAPEVMLARKGETDLDYLERRNRQWQEMADHDPSIVVVDANRPLDSVYHDVVAAIADAGSRPPSGSVT